MTKIYRNHVKQTPYRRVKTRSQTQKSIRQVYPSGLQSISDLLVLCLLSLYIFPYSLETIKRFLVKVNVLSLKYSKTSSLILPLSPKNTNSQLNSVSRSRRSTKVIIFVQTNTENGWIEVDLASHRTCFGGLCRPLQMGSVKIHRCCISRPLLRSRYKSFL